MASYRETCVGFQKLTVTNAVAGTQLTVPTAATYCEFLCEGENARVRFDGTAPDATTGDKAWEDGSFAIFGRENLLSAKLISESATNATLQIHYYC